MITAKELAKQLNLSEAAVSMALNGKVGVSEKTRARVLAAAEEQGYDFSRIKERQFEREHPEGNILFLIFKKHGAVVADTPFFSELTQGIEAETRKQGYRLLVRYVYEEDSRAQFSLAAREGFGGAVILGTEMDEGDLPLLSLLPFPVVLLDTYFEGAPYDSVLINNVQGAYLATSYLISKYRTQAGYLSSSYPINNFSERADGFYK
ncbi:MAG TPA: LacI family DNA-binding transcriptional regulator, partial [Candidatus Gallimonas gallistercoris]|nr:LacI family DNA-binding transcriptional regulator [Candidatus Gallimonas gallistercoris]